MFTIFTVFAILPTSKASRKYIMQAGRLDKAFFHFETSKAHLSTFESTASLDSSKRTQRRFESPIPHKKPRLQQKDEKNYNESLTKKDVQTVKNVKVSLNNGMSKPEVEDMSKTTENTTKFGFLYGMQRDALPDNQNSYNKINLPQTNLELVERNAVKPVGGEFNTPNYVYSDGIRSNVSNIENDKVKDQIKLSSQENLGLQNARSDMSESPPVAKPKNDFTSTTDGVLEALKKNDAKLLEKDHTRFSFLYFDYGKASKMATFVQDMKWRKNNKYNCSDMSVPLQTHFISRYKHNVSTNDPVTRRFLAKLNRPMLYGDIGGELKQNEGFFIKLESILKVSKRFGNACSFLDSPELSNHTYENIKDLFLLFLVNTCLCFDNNLQCYILKDSLWGMHVYMSEFYIYILWIFRQFYLEQKHEIEIFLARRSWLIEDMRYICMLLDIYNGIEESKKDLEQKIKQIGMMFIMVEQYRDKIQEYLEIMYPKSEVTALYYIAINMRNKEASKKNVFRILRPNEDQTIQNSSSKQRRKPDDCASINHSHKIKKGKYHLKYYYNLLNAELNKNAIFTIAFTVNYTGFAPFKYNLAAIKKLQETNTPLLNSMSHILKIYIMEDEIIYAPFDSAVINFVNFLKLIRNGNISSALETSTNNFCFIDKINIVPIKPNVPCHRNTVVSQRLNMYRDLILEQMGV